MKGRKKISLSTTWVILLSFIAAILFGSLLLALPVSSADGKGVPYIDALFTAATAGCVTGLVTVPTFSAWSLFGQAVILFLIQIGGLGVITVMSGFMLMLHRKMGIGDRLLIQDAFNLNTMAGLGKFIKSVLSGTLLIEGIGALIHMLVFVPDFGLRGVWISVFHSVSAFCNAGIDVIGERSLCDYATNPLVNITTAALIVLGGVGYIVWWDVLRVLKNRSAANKKIFRHLTLHSKIAITATLLLLLGGTGLFLAFEYANPLTIGSLPFGDKLQVAFFQSVTTRTAGFASVPQENLTDPSALVSLVLMCIGGSPVGTAGGVKTVTVVVLLCSAAASIRNKRQASVFHRVISDTSVRRAIAVVTMFTAVTLTSVLALSLAADAPVLDVLYESVSAAATVGLTRNLTASLGIAGKIVIIITMYFGRVGPISLAVALGSKGENQNVISEPTEEISIG